MHQSLWNVFRTRTRPTMTLAASSVRVSLGQMTTTDDIESNLRCIEEFTRSASSQGSKMLFLPENACFMSSTGPQASLEMAESLSDGGDSVVMKRIRDMCKKHEIWMSIGGFQEVAQRDGETGKTNKLFNSHVIVDNTGKIVCIYRKIHLFDLDYTENKGTENEKRILLKESSFTEPGQCLQVCDSPIGRLGLTVCFDMRFPYMYQKLCQNMGAQILLIPAAFTVPTGKAHWEILLRARAIENQAFVIASAQSGRHNPNRESWGRSMIIDPWGEVIECIDTNGAGLVTVDLDLGALGRVRSRMPMNQRQV